MKTSFYIKKALLSIALMSSFMSLYGENTKQLLHSNWIARQASSVLHNGLELTGQPLDDRGWIQATVPGTVLTTLLNNNYYPDPAISLNNELIPDIYHVGNDFYTYWFVNRFEMKSLVASGDRVWLNFRGINYKAEIFLNGKRISHTTHEGMFLRVTYDITDIVRTDGVNTLAVLVFPPDYPGNPNGGQGGDGQIAKNVTMHYTPGWDWIQTVRDRNTGIWDEVSVTTTGAVRLIHPYVTTKVPGVRNVSGKQADASVKVKVELSNTESKIMTGTLYAETAGQTVSMPVKLNPRETKEFEFKDFRIQNPRLWWPHPFGEQPLYDLKLYFKDATGKISDVNELRYGIREIKTEKDPITGGRKFYVNGQPVFVRGGNYINSDWLLRLSKSRYEAEVRFHREMNLNMIRIWGGALTERPEFYEACDKYGMLVFQDLWVTGDCNGAWVDRTKKDSKPLRNEYPDNHRLFLESVIDQVKMLRNHPSLTLWCGGNEWPAAPDIVDALQNDVFPVYDPERLFAVFSTDTVFTANTIGGVGDGPYGIQETDWFFKFKSTPFNPELGSVGLSEIETLEEIFMQDELKSFPRGAAWQYHKYIPYGEHINRYGDPKTVQEFNRIAQVLNYNQYRSFMEGWASTMWKWYTGGIIWKTQNPWTALRGQMYDSYLEINACLYGTAKGGEPLHAQYNPVDKTVEFINLGFTNEKMKVVADIYTLDSRKVHSETKEFTANANSKTTLFPVEVPQAIDGVYFLVLSLKDASDRLISDNFYWLTTKENDFTSLNQLPETTVDMTVTPGKNDAGYEYKVLVSNKDKIAFFNRLKVRDKATGKRILPVHYSDNYISIVPGDKKEVTISFKSDIRQENIEIIMEGWNVKSIKK